MKNENMDRPRRTRSAASMLLPRGRRDPAPHDRDLERGRDAPAPPWLSWKALHIPPADGTDVRRPRSAPRPGCGFPAAGAGTEGHWGREEGRQKAGAAWRGSGADGRYGACFLWGCVVLPSAIAGAGLYIVVRCFLDQHVLGH